MSTTGEKRNSPDAGVQPQAKEARTSAAGKGAAGKDEVKMVDENVEQGGVKTGAAAGGGEIAAGEQKQKQQAQKQEAGAAGSTAASAIDVDAEMREAQELEKIGRESGQPLETVSFKGDQKRMWEKHEQYAESERIKAQLPTLFPSYNVDEVKDMLVWLAQLPVAMHRPRAVQTGGWRAAGEIMTVQFDEKLPSIFHKMIINNISCLPVLDQRRRYLGLIDTQTLVIHALKAFGIMDPTERASSNQEIAAATAGVDIAVTSKTEAEIKIEESAAAAGGGGGGAAASSSMVQGMAPPVHVPGGRNEYAGRTIWKGDGDKSDWGERWERRAFQDCRACDMIAEEIPTLGGSGSSQVIISEVSLPAPSVEVLAPPLQQGSSTLFAIELLARMGLHRAPILDSDRFLTGLITESMIISLISQYRHKITSFQSMSVSSMIQFLAPHRLVTISEDAITAQAFHCFVRERVTGGAVVNKDGVLVDVLSSRDLRGIGRKGQEFERLWMIVRHFKEAVRREFPDKTPTSVNFVYGADRMVDVLSKMNDGNLHRVFVCESVNDLPHPIAVITQRDVQRLLLIFLGETLQGETRICMA